MLISDSSLEKNFSEWKRRKFEYDSSEDDLKFFIVSFLRGSGDFFNGKVSILIFVKGKRIFIMEGMV